jgi:hypothetical protein
MYRLRKRSRWRGDLFENKARKLTSHAEKGFIPSISFYGTTLSDYLDRIQYPCGKKDKV